MVGEHVQLVFRNAQAKLEKDGFMVLPEGTVATLYVAHSGVGLTVPRVEAVRLGDGHMLHARTAKRESFAMDLEDVFAISLDGAQGVPVRRAGF